METLTDEQVTELFLQVYDHRGLIPDLSSVQKTYLIDYIDLKIHDMGYGPGDIMYKIFTELKQDLKQKPEQNTIIDKIYLLHFYKQFKSYFQDETEETWFQRFVYPCQTPIEPIKIESKIDRGNNRLILFTILDAIQDFPERTGDYVYNNFVLDRFGIKAFQKGKSEHNEKKEYQENLINCRKILRI
jgi:hypothetical protein